jgi:hypothetical protein
MTETQDPLKHACRDLDLIDNTLPLRDNHWFEKAKLALLSR